MTAPSALGELLRLGLEAAQALHAEEGNSQLKAAASLVKTVGSAPSAVSGNPLASLQVIAREVAELHKVVETEETRRQQIASERDVALAQIQASRLLLEQYMTRTFDERRQTLEGLFATLDAAQARDDAAGMQQVMASIVDVVKASPFKDLAAFRKGFEDPDFVLEL